MNFQVIVLKILAAYPDGFAAMEDLKRDMAILATSGRDWADRTRRLAARAPGLDIWSQGLVERLSGGWKITAEGRAVLEVMEARPAASETARGPAVRGTIPSFQEPVPPLRQPADRARWRHERRERRREARERARVNAS
ncbi:hypothetical protein [Bradyrhizobium sp. 168]|uniref:hypothetical protein n=1 Tax=Bradyrhizobium sp. 168 TaxID=2782639 RepID=UPI001FF85017